MQNGCCIVATFMLDLAILYVHDACLMLGYLHAVVLAFAGVTDDDGSTCLCCHCRLIT